MKFSVKAEKANEDLFKFWWFSKFQRDFDLSSYLKHVWQLCTTAYNIDNTWNEDLLVAFSFNDYMNIKVAIKCMIIFIMVVF